MLETRDIIVLVCGQCGNPLEQKGGTSQLWCRKCQIPRDMPREFGEATLVKGRIDICLLANIPEKLITANLKPEAVKV